VKVKLSNKQIRDLLNIETPEFPKYVKQLINTANQNAQGTRPRVVGQMTDLIQQFTGKTFPEWEEWYLKQKPDALKTATDKVVSMVGNLKGALNKVDREMVGRWIRDLVIVQTFIGLRFQEAILQKGAEIGETKWRKSKPSEESKGIDGYIGSIAVSIKPDTYNIKKALGEEIHAKMIIYKKTKSGVVVDYSEVFPE
jgi:uncharacterized protein YukE